MSIYHKIIGQGPDLVLLHGWAFHSGIWKDIVTIYKNHFTIHLLDLPGFGQSMNVPLAATLQAVTQQLLPCLPQRAIYWGWSLGGLLATAIAVYYPERVTKLITLGSTPCFIEAPSWNGVTKEEFLQFYKAVATQVKKSLQQFLRVNLADVVSQEDYFSSLYALVLQFGEPNKAALLTGLRLLAETDLREDIQGITIPALHIVGEKDRLAPANKSFSRREIKGAGHFSLVTHAAALNAAIQAYRYDSPTYFT